MNVRAAFVVLPCLLLIAGCQTESVATPPLQASETTIGHLVRGNSTRADVERLLGTPTGTGGSRLPPDWQTREIWMYQSIKIAGIYSAPATTGDTLTGTVLQADLNQQVLLVFFSGDRFDGYLWYTN